MTSRWWTLPGIAVALLFGFVAAAIAQQKPVTKFTPEMLNDASSIGTGAQLWEDICSPCHGRNAYPGKAPALSPGKYSPEFVYHRLSYGFRGMPAWEETFDEDQRRALVAYIMSPSFAP